MGAGLAEPGVSRHKCLIYDGQPSELLSVVVPFLVDGLTTNWRCLYLGDATTIQMVERALSGRGVNPQTASARGALILSSDRDHLATGTFNPRALIDALRAMIDDAVAQGFEGLCASGDMRWELGNDENFEQLLEYEALLEQVFREKPLRGICQYRRDLVPSAAIRDALLTHRTNYIGSELNRDNLFYIPPELLLERKAGEQGEWMCQQILRVLNAERTRDQALTAWRESATQQRRLAAQLAQANEELEHRVAERTAELQAANAELESFSYSVSHDLRAPLRAIGGFAEILGEDCAEALGNEGRRHLERVRENVRKMNGLIDGLLTLSRVTKTALQMEPVDLTSLAVSIARELREATPERVVDFRIQPGLSALGDPRLLRALLENLLGNAWKFTAKVWRAVIEVGVLTEGTPGAFFVRDNGAGFDPAHASRLFGAFQLLHSADDFPGTGIVLATVQRIVRRHHGRIWAESTPGKGATFFFTLS
jgi:signal transduction histidine kinase